MKRLSDEIIQFFQHHGYVVVSTIDNKGRPHSSCKGIVRINRNGRVFLLDLYRNKTFANLKHNSRMNITAVDEHRFVGYCLKGKAKIATEDRMGLYLLRGWEDRITARITQRVIRNMRGEKGHPQHPEALLPKPEYLIAMDVEEIVDLTPYHIKQGR